MPWHKHRTWVVEPVESAEALAEKLIGHSWCCCQGWELHGYLFLNDATSEDGAFEVAVLKRPGEDGQWWQVESITFGWFLERPPGGWPTTEDYKRDEAHARERAEATINTILLGSMDPGEPDAVALKCEPPRIDTPADHGRCILCA